MTPYAVISVHFMNRRGRFWLKSSSEQLIKQKRKNEPADFWGDSELNLKLKTLMSQPESSLTPEFDETLVLFLKNS